MDALNLAYETRKFSTSSYNTYKRVVGKMDKMFNPNKDEDFDLMGVLMDYNKVAGVLNDMTYSTSQQMISTILLLLSPTQRKSPAPSLVPLYNKYNDLLKNEQVKHKSVGNIKTDKEKKNWIDYNMISNNYLKPYVKKSKQIDLSNPTPTDKDTVFKTLLLSLYMYLPPRRLEYSNVSIMLKKDYSKLPTETKNSNNYMVIQKSPLFFSWGDVKSPTLEAVVVKIPKELKSVVNIYMKINSKKSGDNLLSIGGKSITSNRLTKELNKIFAPTKISASMLRKIYLTHKYGEVKADQAIDAENMNHTIAVQQNEYVKDN